MKNVGILYHMQKFKKDYNLLQIQSSIKFTNIKNIFIIHIMCIIWLTCLMEKMIFKTCCKYLKIDPVQDYLKTSFNRATPKLILRKEKVVLYLHIVKNEK